MQEFLAFFAKKVQFFVKCTKNQQGSIPFGHTPLFGCRSQKQVGYFFFCLRPKLQPTRMAGSRQAVSAAREI